MTRTAIFVEGQTELIFVKTILLHHYNYAVDIVCNKLYSEGNFDQTNYDNEVPNANFHYRIIDVGNDNSVLQRMIDRQSFLLNAGYSIVVGLRDMYSAEYLENSSEVNLEVIRKFISSAQKSIELKVKDFQKFKLCFAIMEVESWFLGLNCFHKIDQKITAEYLTKELQIDLVNQDPEKYYLRPTSAVKSIYTKMQRSYDKSEKVVTSLCSKFDHDDILRLKNGLTCRSFSYFLNQILQTNS